MELRRAPARGTLGLREHAGNARSCRRDAPRRRTTRRSGRPEHTHCSTNLGPGQKVVGHNNIGDVTFDWGAGDDKTVIQTLWWRLDGMPRPLRTHALGDPHSPSGPT